LSPAREETGSFRAPDGTPLAWTRLRTGAKRLVVVSPGILMDRGGPEHRLLAARLAGLADVLTLDTRGHGDSGGRFSFGVREPEDLAALVRSLRPEYERVGGLGFSFGGFHTIVAAARHGVFDAVAVVGTPHRLFILDHNFLTRGLARSLPLVLRRRRRRTRLGLWPRGLPAVPSRLVGRIAPRPLLVVHGADDWLVPPSHARRLHAAAGEPKQLVLVERGLHAETMLLDAPEPLLEALVTFLDLRL
jgi:pimeloyl-ACP methyl ester carboxylesterase